MTNARRINPLTSVTSLLVVASLIFCLLFWYAAMALTRNNVERMRFVPTTMQREAAGLEPGVYTLTVDCKMVRIPTKPQFWVVLSGETNYRPVDKKDVL